MKTFIPIVNHSLKYNSSIDGLRGVAISLVLLFHIWPKYFSFGYVGVDIFFVLSGYLITQIIYTKLESDTFDLKEFYRNRIRRIFPTLIVVLTTTLLIGYLFMFSSEFEQLGQHIKSSALFYENFRLIKEVGYWDESASLKPLLHFWSLAIEEQFYIFWPLLLIFLYKTRVNIVISLSILFLILFSLPLIIEFDKFYHTLSRAWELAFGGLVFIVSYKYKNIFYILNKYKYLIYLFFFISIVLSYNNSSFNTYKTFLIVFFSGLLILSISYDKSRTMFSNNTLVFIGLISFPLYLWHYVLISFTHIFGVKIDISIGLLLIFLSVLLLYFTYRYIEIYARAKSSYIFVFKLFIVVLILGFIGDYISKKNGLPNRSHLESNENFEKQFIRTPAQNDLGISLVTKVLGYKPTNNYIKATSDDITKKYMLIIGDSHALALYDGLSNYFINQKDKGLLLLAQDGCSPVLDTYSGKTIKSKEKCKQDIENTYKLLENKKFNINTVIFVERGPKNIYLKGFGDIDNTSDLILKKYEGTSTLEEHKSKWITSHDLLMNYFNSQKYDFYYLLEHPELGFDPKHCLKRPFNIFVKDCRIKYIDYFDRHKEYRELIFGFDIKYNNVKIIDTEKLFCDEKWCYAVINNELLYIDDDHLSKEGSKLLSKYIQNIIFKENPNEK
ncbi:acyltransferase [Aliarcobacter butzleri]|uniref:acyltransferase family protein n=1 Tax=Aliarcobacter butzleri TaxID=28197 RepID=UPI001EDA8E35|nr:acyltransferase family protein [Aliarcobacter butzleri]MCG3667920.1 acyltransferase [Aliarcobacter butzleri]